MFQNGKRTINYWFSRSTGKFSRNLQSISTTANLQSDDFKAAQQKEAPQIKNDVALLKPEDAAHRNQLQNAIQIEGPVRAIF